MSQTATPLKVWGGSALTMTVDADDSATADYPYNMRVGLTNVSDIPIYNPSVTLSDSARTGRKPFSNPTNRPRTQRTLCNLDRPSGPTTTP